MGKDTFRFEVDISGLERHYKQLEVEVEKNTKALMTREVTEAEERALELIDKVIYDTPERGGYKRTGALKRSIYAVYVKRGYEWHLEVGALGSPERAYALYNERGTYKGRVTLDSIMKLAMKNAYKGLIVLEYGDAAKGLEPRPWTIPVVVMMNRDLGPKLDAAIAEAELVAGER